MSISITVKNTFLDVKKFDSEPHHTVRRSSSVPRTFKLGDYQSKTCTDAFLSDDSTNASEKGVPDLPTSSSWASDTEEDLHDLCSNCTDDDDFWDQCAECSSEHSYGASLQTDDQKSRGKLTLSLSDMVTAESEKVRLKLRPQAVPFKSARAPPAEVAAVIAAAVEVLASGKDILDVQVRDGGMGATTTIMAKTSGDEKDAGLLFSLVKDALLNAAEQSENTYVVGYGNQPFNNLDTLSFSASLCCVPAAHRNTACWCMYEKGFCPRRSTCRWDHPAEIDMMRIIFMVKKA